jgi:hypothetical protein
MTSDRSNNLTYSLHARLPVDEEAAHALWQHLHDFTTQCAEAGWSVEIVVTMTKDNGWPAKV